MQSIFLVAYRLVRKSGVFESGVGQACFEGAYDLYKRLFEASHADWLRPLARPGTTVVDIGANIGFFTVQFARWVGSQGRVIAIEPETRNLARLRKRITGQGLASNVEIVEAVVAEKPGTLNLHLNPDHPGDHRIGSEGVPVTSVTLDGLLEDAGWPEVSLVKVDVQGAEFRVFLAFFALGAAAFLATLALFAKIQAIFLVMALPVLAGLYGRPYTAMGNMKPVPPFSVLNIAVIISSVRRIGSSAGDGLDTSLSLQTA